MFRSNAIFVFLVLAFSLPVAYADDMDDGKNVFLWNCLNCHAFACNKYGPRLGG